MLVVGGGATGVGVARDAALRGLSVVLVERRDLAEGTTGRFHGLLHSGGRYVVKDAHAARECMEENRILRRIAAQCIEDTGGLFVCTPTDDTAYGEQFTAGCATATIPVEEIDPAEALRREPLLNPGITRAFAVPDGAIDTWQLVGACAQDIVRHGGTVLTYHDVVSVIVEGDRVCGARVRDTRTGVETEVRAEITVSATGAWAGQFAQMAGCTVSVRGGRGVMVALNHRLTHAVINRCRLPGDSDILVPAHTVSRDRHDRRADRRSRRPHRPRRRCAQAAGRGLRPRPAHPRRPRAARVGRPAAALQRASGRLRHARADPRLHAARPPRAGGRGRLPHDHGRQADDVPADGRGDGRRRLRAPRRRRALPHRRRDRCPAARTGTRIASATAWPRGRATCTTSR